MPSLLGMMVRLGNAVLAVTAGNQLRQEELRPPSWTALPPVMSPGAANQPPKDDDGTSQGQPELHH
jgi:hypothetical protein